MKVFHAYITNRFRAVILFVVIFCLFFLVVNVLWPWVPEVDDFQFGFILSFLAFFDVLISFYFSKKIATRRVEVCIGDRQLHIKWLKGLFQGEKEDTVITLAGIQSFEYARSGGKYRSLDIFLEPSGKIKLRGRSLPFGSLLAFDELAKSTIAQTQIIKAVPVTIERKGRWMSLAQLIVDVLSIWA